MENLKKFRDWFWYWPSENEDYSFSVQVKTLNTFSIIISIIAFVATAIYSYIFKDEVVFTLGSSMSLLVFCVPLLFKKTKNFTLAYHAVLMTCFVLINVITFKTDGFHGPLPHWMIVLPMVAALISSNKKDIIIYGSIGMIANFAFYFLAVKNYLPPQHFVLSKLSLDAKIRGSTEMNIAVIIMSFAFKSIVDESLSLMKESSRRYENLLRLVVHDSATPLTIIGNSATKLKKDGIESPYLNKIAHASTLLNSLISQVRYMSSYSSGKLKIDLEEVDPIELLDKLEFLFEERLREKKISLRKEVYRSSDCTICGDTTILLHQILGNLISNAIKFSLTDSVILIKIEETTDKIKISICDNGIGIPEEKLGTLFAPNFHTSTVGTSGERGTGFGLPLAKTFTTALGGTIDVISSCESKSHGTEFILAFPKSKPKLNNDAA
ncbi:MAG: hypothetical protein OHK0056_31550 [Bacteriovoracaceae bacterium]